MFLYGSFEHVYYIWENYFAQCGFFDIHVTEESDRRGRDSVFLLYNCGGKSRQNSDYYAILFFRVHLHWRPYVDSLTIFNSAPDASQSLVG